MYSARVLNLLLLWSVLTVNVVAQKTTPTQSSGKQKQQQDEPKKKAPAPFQWVNPPAADLPDVTHATFKSPSMNVDVGYCIYLPKAYSDAASANKRFPVVYYLHGGRPGSETKSVALTNELQSHIDAGEVAPMIYVFSNGGPVSHYNMPDRDHAMGEDILIKELIPHVDKTYRTIATRRGRGLEGFSQGGRGTTRIMFKYPAMFCSAAPGGAGYATEKRISEENGKENESLVFTPGDNTYDLARRYADHPVPSIPILIHVGTKGTNYENNLAYMQLLDTLKIPYQRLIVADAEHSARQIYQKQGLKLMQFHAKNFGL